MNAPYKKRRRTLWQLLCRGAALLYAIVGCSWLGRLMTGYRHENSLPSSDTHRPGQYRFRPVSAFRFHVAEALKAGRMLKFVQRFFHALYVCPLRFYGLFGLFYGVFGILLYSTLSILPIAGDLIRNHEAENELTQKLMAFINEHLIENPMEIGTAYLLVAVALTLVSIPMLTSQANLSEALSKSRMARRFLGNFLSVPLDHLQTSSRGMTVGMPFLAFFLALFSAVASLFIPPLTIPFIVAVVAVVGMVYHYPEAGVVLMTALLPTVGIWENARFWLAALTVVTWLSYGLKLLLLHRTLRFGLLEGVCLLLAGLVLFSGFSKAEDTGRGIAQSMFLFLCISDYFLIVNLMTTREYIRRCFVGVGISVGLVTLLSYVSLLPAGTLDWMAGSRAGNAIIAAFGDLLRNLEHLWDGHGMLLLLATFPWLCTLLYRSNRPFHRMAILLWMALELALMVLTQSYGAVGCVLVMMAVFFLLFTSKSVAVGAVLALPVTCGIAWLIAGLTAGLTAGQTALPHAVWDAVRDTMSMNRMLHESSLHESIRLAGAYPLGIGVGVVEDSGNLLLEFIHNYGVQGALVAAVLMFLFVQKSMTAMRHISDAKDRAILPAGISGLLGVLIYGASAAFLSSNAVVLSLMILMALCSSYGNIVFDESDIMAAEAQNSFTGLDRTIRRW